MPEESILFSGFRSFYRNKLKHLLRISKRIYYNYFFNNIINNTKSTWKEISQIISLKPQSIHEPTKIIKENIELVEENLLLMLLMTSLLTLEVN